MLNIFNRIFVYVIGIPITEKKHKVKSLVIFGILRVGNKEQNRPLRILYFGIALQEVIIFKSLICRVSGMCGCVYKRLELIITDHV